MSENENKDSFAQGLAPPAALESFVGAAGRGDLDAVAAFLEQYPSCIDWQNDRGNTALIMAAVAGHEETALFLLQKGADAGLKNKNGWAALTYAAWNKFPGMAELLLDNGADPNHRDNAGWTPLMRAVMQKHEEISALLLERGARIDAERTARGLTPLMLAAMKGDARIAGLLLEKGASCDETDIEGKTAAMIAKEMGNPAAAQVIERWAEKRRLEKNAALDAKAREIASAQIEKLKNRRPPKNPFKEGKPRP